VTTPHDETCARCDRRICVCGCQCVTCVPVERGSCFDQFHGIGGAVLICTLPAEHKGAHRSDDGAQWSLVPDADQGDNTARCECGHAEASHWSYVAHCLGCDCQRYRPAPAARPAHADAVMADLGAAITEGVTEARLRVSMKAAVLDHTLVGGNRDGVWCRCGWDGQGFSFDEHRATATTDAVLALPEMRALLDSAAKVQRVEALADELDKEGLVHLHNGPSNWNADTTARIRAALGGEG
jgi:hypothetical protein